MQYENLRPLLKELRFNGMLAHLDESMALSEIKKMTAIELVQHLLEVEAAHRQTRSLVYRLTLARLPQVKSLEHFDWSNTPIQQEKFSSLTNCQFIEQKQNLLLIGGSGTGKSHIALALAHKALTDSFKVKFYLFSDLARQLLQAKENRYEQSFMERLKRFHLLVIDELGYLPIDQQAGALLFELFSKLYETTSLIITTHLTFDEWAPLFGNAKASKAIIDRITHHCVILETGNKSWRLKEGSMPH
jgi:DNA replication protein DnaC